MFRHPIQLEALTSLSINDIIDKFVGTHIDLKKVSKDICDLLIAAFDSVKDAEEVPGTAPENCGNCLMHNLPFAKWYAARFADYLRENKDKPETFEYPKAERLVTDDGRQFFDS